MNWSCRSKCKKDFGIPFRTCQISSSFLKLLWVLCTNVCGKCQLSKHTTINFNEGLQYISGSYLQQVSANLYCPVLVKRQKHNRKKSISQKSNDWLLIYVRKVANMKLLFYLAVHKCTSMN